MLWRERIAQCLAGSVPRHEVTDWLIPGLTGAQSQALRAYFPPAPQPAAVLVPLVERASELSVLLTQRATQLKNHAGQVSFPGGRVEQQDADVRATALREAHEEIGLEARFVSIAGYLPDHIIISGFRVTPVVGFVSAGFELQLDAREVQETFEVPLSYVFRPENHRRRLRRFGFGQGEAEAELCDIPFEDRNIWGATAGMLVTLYRICALGERP